jgi:hypothetical protein
MNEPKKQNIILKYWQILFFVGVTIFNIGYTVARLETYATVEYVNQKIGAVMETHKNETNDNYIKIDRIPGLNESLQSINEKLDDLKKRFEKLDDKINYQKK